MTQSPDDRQKRLEGGQIGKPAAPKRRGAQRLAALIPETLAPILRQRGFVNATLLTEWREIAGPHIARWSAPLELRWPKRRGEPAEPKPPAAGRGARKNAPLEAATRATLVIACPGAFALDLQMATPRLIEAVNRRLGFAGIGAIMIKQVPRRQVEAPAQPAPPDPTLVAQFARGMGDIEDAGLRQALATMAASLSLRNQPAQATAKPPK